MIYINLFNRDIEWNTLYQKWCVSTGVRHHFEIKSISNLWFPTIVIIFLAAAENLYSGRILIAAMLIGLCLIVWQVARLIVKSNNVRPFMLVTLTIGAIVINIDALAYDPVRPLIASPVLPVFAFIYLGRGVGKIFSGLFFINIILLLFVFNPTTEPHNAFNILICYTMITLVTYLYAEARIKTEQSLEELSNTDMLTGAFNRRVLDQVLNREISRSHREYLPLSVLMVDIDDFKLINDTHGHQTGDKVLTNICQVIQDNIRTTDLLIRFGGDEFIIVTPTTDYKHAKMVSEKILKAVKKFDFGLEKPVGTSIGIAELEDEDTVDSFLRRADQALYLLKSSTKSLIST